VKRNITYLGIAALLIAALAAGYWLGNRGHGTGAAETETRAQDDAKSARKILFYRNPMGLPDTSPTPKLDSMGMDYLPVHEGEEESSGLVNLSTEKIQKLGVRTEPAELRNLGRSIRAVGITQINEQKLYSVAPRFEAWIDRLYVNTTGQYVQKDQELMEVYSPELSSAQAEYTAAAQAGLKILADASLERLRNWGIDEAQLGELSISAKPRQTVTLRAPAAGIVLEKNAVQGMRFMAGETLYKIADLSTVWITAEIFEQDLAFVKTGQKAKIRINAYPDQQYSAKIAYIYPTLSSQTRTTQIRLELANRKGLLKPGMYAEVQLDTAGKSQVIAIPNSAVIDSGTRKVALVEVAEGRFEPRELELGMSSDDYVEVISGIGEGEKVVTRANFLIDAESNLKAALSGLKPND
jgi:multidrug efflux pump subunit AcrA (membrane-fusion protein)